MSQPLTVRKIVASGPVHHIRIQFPRHAPHWKSRGEGHAQLDVTTHDKAGWISLDAQEFSSNGGSKRTMLTLDEADGRALYERLKKMYEGDGSEDA